MKNILVLLWVVISTLFYGTLGLLFAPINKRFSRSLGTLWSLHLLMVTGIRIVAHGAEKLDPHKRYVFLSNHQSHIDIPVLFRSLKRPLAFIAKKELFQIPFFGWCLHAHGHVWIDRTNARKAHASINRAVTKLQKENISLVLFPEGTRSSDGTIGQLKQGSFSLVQKAGVEVVPIVIHDTFRIVKKYSNKVNSGTVHVTIGTPFSVDPALSKAEIAEKVRSIMTSTLEAGPAPG